MPIPIVRRPGIPTSVGDHETRLRALERRQQASGNLGIAHALFNAAEVEAATTKILVPGIAGTLIFPIWYLLAPSAEFEFSDTGTGPQFALENPTWSWSSFDVLGLGQATFGNFAAWLSDGSTSTPPVWSSSTQGEPLQVTSTPNDLTPGSVVGYVDVWTFWNRIRVTQP